MDIYKATNNITEKSYIGYATKGWEDRKSYHEYSACRGNVYYFQNAIKTYGKENFRWIVLEQGITDFELLKELEIYWIREFGTKKPNGYNLTEGGDGSLGLHPSEETKRKISEAIKGKILSEETKRKISEARKGKILSEEHKRKLSEVAKVRKLSEEHKRKISGSLKGRILSEETKKRIGKANKGKVSSMKGKHHTEETKRKISEASKNRREKGV